MDPARGGAAERRAGAECRWPATRCPTAASRPAVPGRTGLSIAPLAPSGRNAFHDTFSDVRAILGQHAVGAARIVRIDDAVFAAKRARGCARACRRRSTGDGARSAGSTSTASSRSRSHRGSHRRVMPLRALYGRNWRRLAASLATATRLTGTDRSMPLNVPWLIAPYGMTLPLLRLTRSRPRVPT